MALKFEMKKAKNVSYGKTRDLDDIKYIVIHYTGNNGDTAKDNADYFANGNTRQAGAHVFVDGGTYVYKSVPLTRVAWAVGGFFTQKSGAGKYYKKCTNANSLSIEMCNCAKSVPTKVFNQTVQLTKYYMKKYNIPADHVIRHWDVNGKDCPFTWAGANNAGWEKFKKAIQGTSSTSVSKSTSKKVYGKVNTKSDPLNMRKTASAKAAVICKIKKGAKVEIVSKGTSWHKVKYNGKTGYCSAKYVKLL